MRNINIFLFFIIGVFTCQVYAQNYTDSWVGHYSYLDIKDVSKGENKVYGAAENAIFSYDTQTEEIEKLSTINGLSGETISSIKYIEEESLLLIGFENGLIQVYNESSKDFLTVVDILDKPSIPPNDKRINHFMIYNGFAYISTGFGISLFDISNLEFGDTYFIGNGGTQININQIAIFEDFIYAASSVGIKKADVNNVNLIDFNQWQLINGANWVGISSVNNKLFASRLIKRLYTVINDAFSEIALYTDEILDTRSSSEQLIITTEKEVYVYNPDDLNVLANVTLNETFDTRYTVATVNDDNEIYVGTKSVVSTGKPGYGILKTTYSDTSILEEVHPPSPLANKFFQIRTQAGEIWATHGGHSVTYNFNGGTRRSGISHYIQEEWNNITFDSLETTIYRPWYLTYPSINPTNTSQVFVGSYFSGLIDVNSETVSIYNQDNSTLLPFAAALHLTLASNYDSNGVLWVLNGRVNTSLNKFENGVWTSFSLEDLISPPTSNLGFSSIVFDKDSNIFMGSHGYGIIGYNPSSGTIVNISEPEENMPSPSVKTIAVDKQGQLWTGSDKGIRIVFNTTQFMEGEPEVSNIVILDDGIPRELLFQQFVTDIEVDGSNNKWVATLDTGVYYFSSDGQETIYHFTKDNSPLPTNDVLDIAIDDINGQVYFATDKGMIAFNSETSVPVNDLEEAYAYPNPVRPNFNINEEKIKIKGITGNVNIKITDIEGNLVTEAESRTNSKFKGYNLEIDGGTALWNGKNMSNRTVATGVYLVLISDLDSFQTKTLKLMVVR